MYMVHSVTGVYSVTDVWYPKFSKFSEKLHVSCYPTTLPYYPTLLP